MSKRERRKREKERAHAHRVQHPPCGGCTVCCVVLYVPELRKLDHEPCVHLCARGCALHDTPEQPELCKTWQCAYRRGMLGPRPQWRPDRLGVLIYGEVNGAVARLARQFRLRWCARAYEIRSGAAEGPAYLALKALARQDGLLITASPCDATRFTAPQAVRDYLNAHRSVVSELTLPAGYTENEYEEMLMERNTIFQGGSPDSSMPCAGPGTDEVDDVAV